MPLTVSRRARVTAAGARYPRRVAGELVLGLLAGVLGGWIAGLLRVRP